MSTEWVSEWVRPTYCIYSFIYLFISWLIYLFISIYVFFFNYCLQIIYLFLFNRGVSIVYFSFLPINLSIHLAFTQTFIFILFFFHVSVISIRFFRLAQLVFSQFCPILAVWNLQVVCFCFCFHFLFCLFVYLFFVRLCLFICLFFSVCWVTECKHVYLLNKVGISFKLSNLTNHTPFQLSISLVFLSMYVEFFVYLKFIYLGAAECSPPPQFLSSHAQARPKRESYQWQQAGGGGGQGAECPPETSNREISADQSGKDRQEKMGNGVRRREIKKAKMTNLKLKLKEEKLQNEERTFFFFFFFSFPVENFHFGRPKTNFSHFQKWKAKKKSGKMTLPLQKNFPVTSLNFIQCHVVCMSFTLSVVSVGAYQLYPGNYTSRSRSRFLALMTHRRC